MLFVGGFIKVSGTEYEQRNVKRISGKKFIEQIKSRPTAMIGDNQKYSDCI